MNLRKKCVANDGIRASRNVGQHSSKPVGQAVRANTLEIQVDEPSADRLTFIADFTREHSVPGPYIALIEISGSF
jgi:hypothetical protein